MKCKPKNCEKCGASFTPKYRVTEAHWKGRRFCSYLCARAAMKGEPRSTRGVVRVTLADRFWSKVVKADGCWLWTGAAQPGGYGYIGSSRGNPKLLAHRVSYELNIGKIPKGLCVCHKCDNPPCVNPAHLFLGTRADNNHDRTAKGREYDRRGEHNPKAKLTRKDIAKVFRLRDKGLSQQAIADQFGVCQVNISAILRGKIWKRKDK